jgi:hypothetical protein
VPQTLDATLHEAAAAEFLDGDGDGILEVRELPPACSRSPEATTL